MRKIFKKVVTAVASMAMLAGMVAGMPTLDAKAAADGSETEIVVVLSDNTDVDKLLLDLNPSNQNAGITCEATVNTELGWGRDMYEFTQSQSNPKMYSITVKGSVDTTATPAEYCTMQFVLVDDSSSLIKGFKYYSQDQSDMFNNNSKIYISVNTAADDWSNFSSQTTDPTAITAAEVIAAIAAIGDVEYTAESLEKIEAAEAAVSAYEGSESDITNLAVLTAARAEYNRLKAAADAAASGTLTIYVTAEDGWETMNVYGWDGADFGSWPGKATTPCEKNDGWFSLSFNITQATNLIFNNGNGVQTADINGVTAGTYWYVIKTAEDSSIIYEVSTTAPTGWVEEQAAVIEQVTTVPTENGEAQAPTTAPTENGEAQVPTTADTTPVAVAVVAILALGLGVVVLNSKKVNR